MKNRILAVILCFLLSNVAISQDKFFEKYSEMEDVTCVHVSKTMFQLILPAAEGMGISVAKNLKDKFESLVLLTTDDEDNVKTLKADIGKHIDKKYEELMRVKNDDTNVVFYVLKKGKTIKELIMFVDSDGDSLVFVKLLGDFLIEDIQQLVQESMGKITGAVG